MALIKIIILRPKHGYLLIEVSVLKTSRTPHILHIRVVGSNCIQIRLGAIHNYKITVEQAIIDLFL